MNGEEKVDKVPSKTPANKTSDVPAGAADSTTASAPANESFVCGVCGRAFDTKHALSGHMSVHSKKTETVEGDVIDEFLDEKETLDRIIAEATPTRKRKAIVRMASRHLSNKRESIEALMEALRLADVDAHLRNLIVKNWASHMDIPDIGDVLDIESKEDKKKIEEDKEKPKEIKKKPLEQLEAGVTQAYEDELERLKVVQIRKRISDMEREMGGGKEEEEEKHILIVDGVSLKVTAQEMLSWKHYLADEKRAEEEREERKAKEKRAEEERKQMAEQFQNDGGLVEWVVGEGNNTMTIKVRPETIPLLIQAQGLKEARNPSQGLGIPSREEVMQMVERTIEAQAKKLTPDDVERIIQRTMGEYRPGSLTKNDLLYLEAKDKLHLEERKLDESGKTRDMLSSAIRGGFSHAGQIISRMMTEEGATDGTQVKGYSNQAKNMIQVPCPGCNTIITAPIGSPMVTCPSCGKRWGVEHQEYKHTPRKVKEKEPSVEDFTPKEKEAIQKSMEDAKKGRMKPLETSESVTDTMEVASDSLIDVEKIAEDLAIGEGVKKLEEELVSQDAHVSFDAGTPEVEKKKKPAKKLKAKTVCPVCKKRFKNRKGVASHIAQKHPEYYKDVAVGRV